MSEHRTESDRCTPPSAIAGWSWSFDAGDCTWNIWLEGDDTRVFCPGVTAERRGGDPRSNMIKLSVWNDVPPGIVAAVYSANKLRP